MTVEITPTLLQGNITAVSSKSSVHRLLIAAMLADTTTTIHLNALSEDIMATVECIRALGAKAEVSANSITVTPCPPSSSAILQCGESGTTFRLLLPVASAMCNDVQFCGKGRLMARPLSPLKEEMEKKGVVTELLGNVFSTHNRLISGEYTLPGNVSSQFISGLLFALPLLEGDSKIIISSPLQSRAYVDMTLDVLKQFGINIHTMANGFYVCGRQKYTSPTTVYAEGDWSNGSFWLCAAALGNAVTVSGLDMATRQGDIAVLRVLEQMGASVKVDGNTVTVTPPPRLKATTVDASQIPDAVPILAATAAFAEGETVFTNAERLRLKESDRIFTTCNMINKMGGNAIADDNSIIITGKQDLCGGVADSFNDHRIAMSLAITATKTSGKVTITDASAVNKSYPDFFDHYTSLGGNFKCHQ